MTVETFKKLVDGGYVTSVGHASFYTNNPDKLVGKSLEDLVNEGAVSKMCADFVVDDEALNETVKEVLEPVKVKDENTIIVPTDTQNNESEIVVDDEPTTDDESTETSAENEKDEDVENVKDEDEVETIE